ncbi:MAG: RNA methyltransferase [Oscillospiraceae bacterium]|nr:RNA methyltransferase [Oscillospiraceae bacterium]
MERLTSRKNETVRRLRRLGAEKAFRRQEGEYLCDGRKLLREALEHGASVGTVLWTGEPEPTLRAEAQYAVPQELLDYVSPMKHPAELLFTVKMRPPAPGAAGRTLVLETVQDPGNLGTILRTANALGMDTVVLTGDCADLYHPKTVRAAMGALFRQRVLELDRAVLPAWLREQDLRLLGAALAPAAADIRALDLRGCAVAIGSEGRGLSRELLELCDGQLIIPMRPGCESLNAAVAAAIVMWELLRDSIE